MTTHQSQPSEIQLFDIFDSEDTVIYTGKASHGADPATPSWLIHKITFNAEGNPISTETTASYVGTWDDRLTETYG